VSVGVHSLLAQTKTPCRVFQTGRFPIELNETFFSRITADSEMETVVLLMGADPKPANDLAFAQTERTVMISDAKLRRYRFAVPRSVMKNDWGHASRVRTFRVPAYEQTAADLRSISRSPDPSCQSRQFLKPASANVFAYFLENWPQPPIFSKIRVDLLVPGSVLALANE